MQEVQTQQKTVARENIQPQRGVLLKLKLNELLWLVRRQMHSKTDEVLQYSPHSLTFNVFTTVYK